MAAGTHAEAPPHGASADEGTTRIDRNQIVRLFGTPDETVGGVNEARIHAEHGVEFNEKWVYNRPTNDPMRPLARILYWQRYDFVAAARIERSGQWVLEPASELLSRAPAGAGH